MPRRDRSREVGVGESGDATLLADRTAEEAIISTLLEAPGVRILSEEAGEVGPASAEFLAVVDPLDGSSNFSRGIPVYCTSIAVAEGDRLRDVKHALVLDLVTGAAFESERRRGAFRDGRRIKASKAPSLSGAAVGIDFSGSGREATLRCVPLIEATRRQVHLGANALELALLAEGAVDCFVDLREKMRVTDFAAAALVIEEAGGVVAGGDGRLMNPRLDLSGRWSMLASGNKRLHASLLSVLRLG